MVRFSGVYSSQQNALILACVTCAYSKSDVLCWVTKQCDELPELAMLQRHFAVMCVEQQYNINKECTAYFVTGLPSCMQHDMLLLGNRRCQYAGTSVLSTVSAVHVLSSR
jgi:hypothetical protein